MAAICSVVRPGAVVLLTLIVAFALLVDLAHGDNCERETFRLDGQGDADALSNCPTLTGNVVIAATATGTIDLDRIDKISGNLSNEECFDGADNDDNTQALLDGRLRAWADCSGLESLASNTLTHITGHVTLRSLVGITSVNLRSLEIVDSTLSVEFLPHLQRMNLNSLETVESLFVLHNRQLVNLTMPQLNNVTAAEESTVELVDLGIYQWPRIKVRIHHYSEETPRRLERLVAKNLPNISFFELNNADEIGLLEVHGLPNQTAQLTTEFEPAGPRPGQPFTDPVAAIGNFTMTGFGGNFTIDSDDTIQIKHVHLVNNTITSINLYRVAEPQSLLVANNADLNSFEMPSDMSSVQWESIEFDNNPRLSFGEDRIGHPQLSGWHWGFNTSTLSIRNSPMTPVWIGPMAGQVTRVKDKVVIAPAGNVTEVCEILLKRTKRANVIFPDGGYTCGSEKHDPKINGAVKGGVPSYSSVSLLVGGLACFGAGLV